MSEVYLVVAGCYSDYTVYHVFSTLDKANAVAEVIGWDARVETYELDPEMEKFAFTSVNMNLDGSLVGQPKFHYRDELYAPRKGWTDFLYFPTAPERTSERKSERPPEGMPGGIPGGLSLIHISEPTRPY